MNNRLELPPESAKLPAAEVQNMAAGLLDMVLTAADNVANSKDAYDLAA